MPERRVAVCAHGTLPSWAAEDGRLWRPPAGQAPVRPAPSLIFVEHDPAEQSLRRLSVHVGRRRRWPTPSHAGRDVIQSHEPGDAWS